MAEQNVCTHDPLILAWNWRQAAAFNDPFSLTADHVWAASNTSQNLVPAAGEAETA